MLQCRQLGRVHCLSVGNSVCVENVRAPKTMARMTRAATCLVAPALHGGRIRPEVRDGPRCEGLYHGGGVHVKFCLNITWPERTKTHGKCHKAKTTYLCIISSNDLRIVPLKVQKVGNW